MSFVATAIVGSAVIGGTVSYLGAQEQADAMEEQANASTQAADAYGDAVDQSTETTWDMYNTSREDLSPWRTTGQSGLYSLADLMGISVEGQAPSDKFGYLTQTFDASKMYDDPGYEFRLSEGEKAIERGAASRGDFFSGATGKALTEYAQDYASNEYQNAYDRYTSDQKRLYDMYSGISNSGLTAGNTMANYSSKTANDLSNLYTSGATAYGNGLTGAASANAGATAARVSGYEGIANALTSAAGNYLMYKGLNKNSSTYPTSIRL